jgi:hypothetical protein
MLLQTLSHFWKDSTKLRLTILTPPQDISSVRDALRSTNTVDIHVVDEHDVIPFLRTNPRVSGWYRQQALKLAYASLASEDFYLTLDADVLCTHEFSGESLVTDNKALTDWEPRTMHPEWWKTSGGLLRLPARPERVGFSVTPAVLSKAICGKLIEYLHGISARDCYKYLLSHFGWTEYSLYNIFADYNDLTYRHHHTETWMSENGKSIRADVSNSLSQNFWSEEQFATWKGESAFDPDAQGLFIVCQSNSNISPSAIWNRVKDRFPEHPLGLTNPAPEGQVPNSNKNVTQSRRAAETPDAI